MTGVELLLGGWFASPVIRSVVEKAQKFLGDNYELQKGTQGLVDTLNRTLLLCQATVKEVENQAIINNPALTDWMRRLKLAVYDAEDVLDNMEAKSIKGKVQAKSMVSKFASSSLSGFKHLFLPDNNHKNLKNIVDNLNQISDDIPKILNLVNMNKNYGSKNYELADNRETISQPLEEVPLYGREDELNLILDMILDTGSESIKKKEQNYNTYNDLLVIPIVGMGGIGKTALAQAVYNNPDVKQTFASKAWISVSSNLDAVLLMRKILQALKGYHNLDVITLEEISKNLTLVIEGVRFLIILDDMFDKIEYQWRVIYKILSCGSRGSVVLITTQNQAFANSVATLNCIALSPLDQITFWKLFKNFAFRNLVMSGEKRIILKSIGKQIAEKLRGLPLAAKIIGNILRSNANEDRWRMISKSEWWDIPEGKNQILPSIGLGYEHLDASLRQCFAYCSVFPRNSVIDKDRLVQIWMALNFIPHGSNGARPEDVGRQWFDKLVEGSFLELAGDNNGYVMPNLMHDLAVIVSSDECFYLNEESAKIPNSIRHIALDINDLDIVKGIQKCKHLRSFFYFGLCHVDGMYSAINETLQALDSIRVLDLSYFQMEEPPAAIQNLKHLRFLDLSSTEIEVLANSSFDHYHLQSLHIKKCQYLKLPKDINKLINLRHLNVDLEAISQISGIGKLTNLQELIQYNVGKQEGHKITELKSLRELRGHIQIVVCDNIKNVEDAMQAKLADKKHLDSIELRWSSWNRESNNDMEIIEYLKPHEHINVLMISGYMGPSFPDWVMEINRFVNLQNLRLFTCVRVEILPPLGELPTLKLLLVEGLESLKLIDQNFYGNKQSVFPALTKLNYVGNPCEKWTEPRNRYFFPSLSTLEITNCYTLKELPLHRFRASLKVLHITESKSLKSLERYLSHLSCLTILLIERTTVSIYLKFSDLIMLEELYLKDCPELSIAEDLQSLVNLKRLEITGCQKLLTNSKYTTISQLKGKGLQLHQGEGLRSLTYIDMDFLNQEYHLIFESLPSLRILNYRNGQLSQFTEYQILWFQQITNLRELSFFNCEFEHIPSSLATLEQLRKVNIVSCMKLESLPANGMPPFLWELTLVGCSQNLVQRCQPNDGEDWALISYIPLIRINGRVVHNQPTSEGIPE